MPLLRPSRYLLLVPLLGAAACAYDGEDCGGSGEGVEVSLGSSLELCNGAPTARLVGPTMATAGTVVDFTAAGSTDPDQDALSFVWFVTDPSGQPASFQTLSPPVLRFTPSRVGDYEITVIVSDQAQSMLATATLSVGAGSSGAAPTAVAGTDQTTGLGSTVQLDGTASADPEGAPLSYAWSIVSFPADSTAVLSDDTSARPSYLADRTGVFVVRLVVNDGVLSSDPDTVLVSVSATAARSTVGDVFDPSRIYTVGSLRPGVCDYTVVAPIQEHAQFAAGFDACGVYPDQGTLRPDGRLVFVSRDGRLREFREDPMESIAPGASAAEILAVFPEDTHLNDPVVNTPALCDRFIGNTWSTHSGEVWAYCRESDGSPFAQSTAGRRRSGTASYFGFADDVYVTETRDTLSVSDYAGNLRGTIPWPSDLTNDVPTRPVEGGWLAVLGSPNDTLVDELRFVSAQTLTASVAGTFAPDAVFDRNSRLGPDGSLYSVTGDLNATRVIRYFPDGTQQVLYEESATTYVRRPQLLGLH